MQAEFLSTSHSSPASVTGYCLTQKCMSSTHFRKGSLLLEKKLPSLMDLVPLHCLHRHTSPSLTFCLLPSTMGTAHLAQLEDEESSPFLLNQLTRSSEGPKITGPNSNRDITSYAVLPAFVMRARLISRPHYVRLRIIEIHCDFSSESYIHIDPKNKIKYLSIQLLIRGTCRGTTELWNKHREFPYLTSLFF